MVLTNGERIREIKDIIAGQEIGTYFHQKIEKEEAR
ncbi:MAG: gamma-glutamyl kinase, partial [Lactococcus petauri]